MSCRKTHEIRSHRSLRGWVNKNKSMCNEERKRKYEFNKLAKKLGIGSEIDFETGTFMLK